MESGLHMQMLPSQLSGSKLTLCFVLRVVLLVMLLLRHLEDVCCVTTGQGAQNCFCFG